MISINHLTKDYKDFHLDVSMDIPAGRITGLVGRNGAGKSTTIKAILGLIEPDGGTVEVLGKDARKLTPEERKNMGVVLAESGFSNYLNIEALRKILAALYEDFDEPFFNRFVSEQGLPEKKKIKEFSTGMKAKLRLIAAFSHKAKLLILDEPMQGLDVLARNEILDILREYTVQDDQRSILISSHISSDLEGLCDDIYMIHHGQVVLHQDTDVVLGSYGVLKVSDEMFRDLDQTYILKSKKTNYGYECLTNERQYYREQYPQIVIENGSIDDLIVMIAGE
ncbi:MAG: ABC transporter ATP-binding protein [Erysipelotrichaceae bacterium]|nr:ABC transporter ATP-binding protein [Erysipelotrichaceae bacterium]